MSFTGSCVNGMLVLCDDRDSGLPAPPALLSAAAAAAAKLPPCGTVCGVPSRGTLILLLLLLLGRR